MSFLDSVSLGFSSPEVLLHPLVLGIIFMMGATIGSFLNVVIYRVPNSLSVNDPKRSFCPKCKTQIPWYYNLPLITWLMLRGRCKWCGTRIAFRYFAVELLTAILFLSIWRTFIPSLGLGATFALIVLACLLVSAIFIDIDHFIIPDSITLGGLVAGLLAALAFPKLLGETSHWKSLLLSLGGAAAGYGLIWSVVTLGKMAFGKLKRDFAEPVAFEISQPEGAEEPIIRFGEETLPWTEVFFRATDRLIVDGAEFRFDGEPRGPQDGDAAPGRLVAWMDRFEIGGEKIALEDVLKVTGTCRKAEIPREAMGYGDIKFMAMIGAFLGWQAVLFTLFVASIVGAVMGLLQKTIGREAWSQPLPFGPYLALGAFTWMFAGTAAVAWYLGLLRPESL